MGVPTATRKMNGNSSSGGGLRMSLGMALNLLLLLAMVATNLLSLYHLTSTTTPIPTANQQQPIPHHLLSQLSTIRSSIAHLTKTQNNNDPSTHHQPNADLLLLSKLSPIGSSCHHHPDLLHLYMNYTPFHLCPPLNPPNLVDRLLLLGCHPLPRRRCFSRSPTHPQPDARPDPTFPPPTSNLDLTVPDLLHLSPTPIRLALDVGGGTGAFAERMRASANATVVTTTMDLFSPNSLTAAALRGVVPLHSPLQQRFPVHDGTVDLVRCGRAVNRWIPTEALEFLLCDADRVLRSGGLLWVDHFFCKGVDLEKVYGPMVKKLGYKVLKWTAGKKTDAGGVRNGEVYLTALLQKHPTK